MFFDGQLGGSTPCNCLIGTAVTDANGNCMCINEAETPAIVKSIRQQPRIVYVQQPAQPQTQVSAQTQVAENTILGLPSWLVYVGGAAIGLYAVAQMGEK